MRWVRIIGGLICVAEGLWQIVVGGLIGRHLNWVLLGVLVVLVGLFLIYFGLMGPRSRTRA